MAEKKGFFREIWEGFRSLPIWAQALIAIIITIIVLKFIVTILTYIKTKSANVKANAEQSAYEATGEKLSFPESQYNTFADQLETGLQAGYSAAAEAQKVFDKIANNLDYLQLQKAFGQRSFSGWFSTYSYSMSEAVNAYLPAVFVQQINKGLIDKGIKYQL